MSHPVAFATLRTILLVGVLLLAVGLSTQAVTVRALTLYDSGDPTSTEQLVLEYINRARANPTAEGTRLGINMWEGLCDLTLVGVRPPLAMNKILLSTARDHNVDEYNSLYFDHTDPSGHDGTPHTFADRIADAGYPGGWVGENIHGGLNKAATWLEDDLMIGPSDCSCGACPAGVEPKGHRVNLYRSQFTEVGIGYNTWTNPHNLLWFNGQYYSVNDLMTQDFGGAGGPFLVGVVYDDKNGNNFYDIGEGVSGVTVTPSSGSYYAVSSTSGGYAFPIGTSGSITVTASGSGFGPISKTVSLTGANVKQDFTKKTVSPVRISTNTGRSYFPSVAASGSYVYVAWEDDTPVSGSGSAHEIWIRASANNGVSFGSAIRISTNTGDSEFAAVAADGSYVYVAWDDDTPVSGSGTNPEIWMRISSNYGVSFGSAIRISNNAYDSLYPSVAAVGSYVYVAWYDYAPVTGSGSAPEIWMRVSNNNGVSFGSAIRISTNTGTSAEPSVAAVGSYVYVAWIDDTSVSGSGGNFEIWLRASSNHGTSFGSPVRISTNTGSSAFPSVAAIGTYVYVAWQDDTFVSGSGGFDEIWMRVSSNNGVSFGSAIRISNNAYMSAGASVAAAGNSVYVAWEDDTPVTGSGTQPEIWMRVSSNNGVSFGSALRITTNTGESSDPSVAAVGSSFCVAWSDNTPVSGSGGAFEIWMRVGS